MFTQLSCLLMFLVPLVALPAYHVIFDEFQTVSLCFAFVVWHCLMALVYSITKILLGDAVGIPRIIELLCMLAFGWYFPSILPASVQSIVTHTVSHIGVLTLFVTSIQVPKLIIFSSRYLCDQLDERPSLIKSIILGVSFVGYLLAGVMIYSLYQHPAIDIPSASCLSIISTLCVVLTLHTVFIEEMVILDTALLSFLCIFYLRLAFFSSLSANGWSGHGGSGSSTGLGTISSFLGGFLGGGDAAEHGMAKEEVVSGIESGIGIAVSFFGSVATVIGSVTKKFAVVGSLASHVLSFNFLLETSLTFISVFSLPFFPLHLLPYHDSSTFQRSSSSFPSLLSYISALFGSDEDEEEDSDVEESYWSMCKSLWVNRLFIVLLLLLYTYTLLSFTTAATLTTKETATISPSIFPFSLFSSRDRLTIEPISVSWRMFQAFLTLGVYSLYLVQASMME